VVWEVALENLRYRVVRVGRRGKRVSCRQDAWKTAVGDRLRAAIMHSPHFLPKPQCRVHSRNGSTDTVNTADSRVVSVPCTSDRSAPRTRHRARITVPYSVVQASLYGLDGASNFCSRADIPPSRSPNASRIAGIKLTLLQTMTDMEPSMERKYELICQNLFCYHPDSEYLADVSAISPSRQV
jgi:hypothetical protein